MRIRLLVLLLLLSTGLTSAKTLSFSPSTAYQIEDAFQGLKSGDRVIFQRGIYKLQRGLTLRGLNDVVLEGKGRVELVIEDLDSAVIAIEDCQNIQVKGLRARHQTPAADYQCEGAVIRVSGSQRVFVAENYLNGCGAAGVYAMSSKDVVIYKNRIFNNSFAGIWFASASGTVHQNKIYDNAAAVITYGDCSVSLTENKVESNGGNIYNDTTFFRKMTGLKY